VHFCVARSPLAPLLRTDARAAWRPQIDADHNGSLATSELVSVLCMARELGGYGLSREQVDDFVRKVSDFRRSRIQQREGRGVSD
jgi:hypothetical protein